MYIRLYSEMYIRRQYEQSIFEFRTKCIFDFIPKCTIRHFFFDVNPDCYIVDLRTKCSFDLILVTHYVHIQLEEQGPRYFTNQIFEFFPLVEVQPYDILLFKEDVGRDLNDETIWQRKKKGNFWMTGMQTTYFFQCTLEMLSYVQLCYKRLSFHLLYWFVPLQVKFKTNIQAYHVALTSFSNHDHSAKQRHYLQRLRTLKIIQIQFMPTNVSTDFVYQAYD